MYTRWKIFSIVEEIACTCAKHPGVFKGNMYINTCGEKLASLLEPAHRMASGRSSRLCSSTTARKHLDAGLETDVIILCLLSTFCMELVF